MLLIITPYSLPTLSLSSPYPLPTLSYLSPTWSLDWHTPAEKLSVTTDGPLQLALLDVVLEMMVPEGVSESEKRTDPEVETLGKHVPIVKKD